MKFNSTILNNMTLSASQPKSTFAIQISLIVCLFLIQMFLIALPLSQPNFGVQLKSNETKGYWQVTSIDPNVQHPSLLDEPIVALKALDESETPPYELNLDWHHQPSNPLWLSSLQQRNTFTYSNEDLQMLQRQDKLGLVAEGGQVYWLDKRIELSWYLFKPVDWLTQFLFFSTSLLTIWLTRFEINSVAAKVLLASATSLIIWQTCQMSFELRALAYTPVTLQFLTDLQFLSVISFFFFAYVFVVLYPMPLNLKSPISIIAVVWLGALGLSILLNSLIGISIHLWIGLFALLYTAAFVRQVYMARRSGIAKASVRWLSLFWLLAAIVVIALMLPAIFGQDSWLNMNELTWFALIIMAGHLVSLLNVNAHQVELWFRLSWMWVLGGFSIIVVDLVLIYWLQFNSQLAAVLSLLIVSWVWFPIRQWVQNKFLSSNTLIEKHIAEIVSGLLDLKEGPSISDDQRIAQWSNLVVPIFKVSKTDSMDLALKHSKITHQGLAIVIPVPGTARSIQLFGKNSGRSLFNSEDALLIDKVTSLAEQVLLQKENHRNTRSTERQRIMRDLHDDVCPLLLTLIHRQNEPSLVSTAREALKRLRESIYSLDDQSFKSLDLFVMDSKSQLENRFSEKAITLSWSITPNIPDIRLSARQHINASRVFNEIASNCLKHSKVSKVSADFQLDDAQFRITFTEHRLASSDAFIDPSKWEPGKGLISMTKRVNEINGSIKQALENGELVTTVTIPFEKKGN